MGLIEFVKGFRKKENSKVSAKRRIAEFRGLTTDCTSEQLIKEFKKFPRVTFPETLGLTELVTKKGDLFSFELLNKDFEAGAEILSRCHAAEPFLKLHKRWLVQSGRYITERQLESLVKRRLEESKAVTDIIKRAMLKMNEEHWIVNQFPPTEGECYTATLYAITDTAFLEPYVHTCEYLGSGNWDTPDGFYVAAWKEDNPFRPALCTASPDMIRRAFQCKE